MWGGCAVGGCLGWVWGGGGWGWVGWVWGGWGGGGGGVGGGGGGVGGGGREVGGGGGGGVRSERDAGESVLEQAMNDLAASEKEAITVTKDGQMIGQVTMRDMIYAASRVKAGDGDTVTYR